MEAQGKKVQARKPVRGMEDVMLVLVLVLVLEARCEFDISFQGLSDTQQTVFPPKPEVDLVD